MKSALDPLKGVIPDPESARHLADVCQRLGLTYMRLFGSMTRDPSAARDVDVVVGPVMLEPAGLAELASALERGFGRPADIVELRPGLSPLLIRRIGVESVPVWEEPALGRADYAVQIDRLSAVADDELLGMPDELRRENLLNVQRRLHGT